MFLVESAPTISNSTYLSETSLSPYTQEIYCLIQDYLRSNRSVDIEKLLDYLTAILSKQENPLNRNGIRKSLNQLINEKLILTGSKLTREEILTHQKRKEIFDVIQENTCLYPYQIHKLLNIPHQMILWHLDVLEKFEFVNIWEIDSHQVYYPSNISLKSVYTHYFSQHSKASAILNLIRSNQESCTQTHIVTELNMHPQTVRKYLKYLMKYRLLAKLKKERKTIYQIIELE